MTEPTLTGTPNAISVESYTNYRIALATAVLGGIGATLGWLVCLAFRSGDAELVLSVIVGAVIGYAVHWGEHYVRAALHEQRGDQAPHHGKHQLRGLLWATAGALVALASEHLITHMIATYLQPFLASLASLIPAGAIIGWSMSRGRKKDTNLFVLVFDGVLIGAAIAGVTGIIWAIAFGSAPWFALLSWWGLVGIGTRIMTGTERNAVALGDPIVAVVMVFVATFLFNLLPLTASSYDKLGAFKTLPVMLRVMSAEIQESPGLPAKFWSEAETAFELEHGKKLAEETAEKPSHSRVDSLTRRPINIAKAVDELVRPPVPALSRPGARYAFFQSWIVILLFSIGAGLAPLVELRLRPIDYPNSETYSKDVRLSITLVAIVAVACLGARFGWFLKSLVEAVKRH